MNRKEVVSVSEKQLERMRELIEKKHEQQEQLRKFKPSRKMGSKQPEHLNHKQGGSNNKV